jgi:perosamine synthetase
MHEPFLPYGRQSVDEEDIARVVEVLRGDYLTTGPSVADFERALCNATGVKHAVAVNSGTSALHALYFGAGLGEGDEIITSPLTFAATANAALYLGATVRFVDVDPETGSLDPALLNDAITDRTKLIVAVDYGGHPADYDAINDVARRGRLTVVADAAHSLGATYKGRPVGLLADATEVSFHPVKPVTTGEGGAVLTNDSELARRARRFQSHGITRETSELVDCNQGAWYYEMHDLGYNYRLTDLQSALGLSQLVKLQGFIARRRAIAKRYQADLSDLESLIMPTEHDDVRSGWHLFVVRVKDPERRRPLFDKLRELGLGVQVHYIPVHLHPYYRRLGFLQGTFPVAEMFYSQAISLPIYPRLTEQQLDSCIRRIRMAVKEVCGE